jgi:hypothetical protein
VIVVRRARLADAAQIGAVHVAAWRSTYPGILPDTYLAGLSAQRQAACYEAAIRQALGVHVASASGEDAGPDRGPARVIGFVTDGPARAGGAGLGEGEIETIYLLDDYRERGLGRRLMRAAATHLAMAGCRSAFVWVLRDNPNRWFYERLGGKPAAESLVEVGGTPLVQLAYIWPDIEQLRQESSQAS